MPQPSLLSLSLGETFWVIENFEMLKRVVDAENVFVLDVSAFGKIASKCSSRHFRKERAVASVLGARCGGDGCGQRNCVGGSWRNVLCGWSMGCTGLWWGAQCTEYDSYGECERCAEKFACYGKFQTCLVCWTVRISLAPE